MENARRNKEATSEEDSEGCLTSHTSKILSSLVSKGFWKQSKFKNSYNLKFLCFLRPSFMNEHIINLFLDQKRRGKKESKADWQEGKKEGRDPTTVRLLMEELPKGKENDSKRKMKKNQRNRQT